MNRSVKSSGGSSNSSNDDDAGKDLGAVMKDKDEDFTIFLKIRKHEKERRKRNLRLLIKAQEKRR